MPRATPQTQRFRPYLAETFGVKFAARFLDVAKPTRFVIYGLPSAQVKDALAGMKPVYMAPLAGFHRWRRYRPYIADGPRSPHCLQYRVDHVSDQT